MNDVMDLERRVLELEAALRRRETDSKATAFGTWTPTLTNTTNVSSSTAELNHYSRIGDKVDFGIRVSVTATGAGSVVLGISLPIASNFANLRDATGTAFAAGAVGGEIRADTTNDRLTLAYTATGAGALAFYCTGSYRVL